MFETGVILVTGAKGMVGSAVCRILHRYPAKQILTPDRQELDLSNQAGWMLILISIVRIMCLWLLPRWVV